jgi:hypothetical protein
MTLITDVRLLDFSCRRQLPNIQASDVVLTNIRSSEDESGVDFDLYIGMETSGTVSLLNQEALLQAVEVGGFVHMHAGR